MRVAELAYLMQVDTAFQLKSIFLGPWFKMQCE